MNRFAQLVEDVVVGPGCLRLAISVFPVVLLGWFLTDVAFELQANANFHNLVYLVWLAWLMFAVAVIVAGVKGVAWGAAQHDFDGFHEKASQC